MSSEENAVVTLRLPSTLSAYSGGKSQILLHAKTIGQLLAVLKQQQPLVWERLCDEHGSIRQHVSIFVDNELIRTPDDLKKTLRPGQEIIVLPTTFGT